jgi:hypothetical protein
MQPRGDSGFSIILLIVLLLAATVLAAGGWFGWQLFHQSMQPRTHLVGAKVKPDLIAFAHRQLPDLYPHITALDDTIALVDAEVDRLSGIAKQYPAQKSLLEKENRKLESVKADLTKTLTQTLGAAETLYVTYLMDPGKGRKAIKKQRSRLRREAGAALKSHAALRHRLSQNQPKGLMDQLLALVGR